MELSVHDRIVLNSLLMGHKDDFATLKLVRQFREELSFSNDENEKLHFKVNGQGMEWSDAADKEIGTKEITVESSIATIIENVLKEISKSKNLTDELFSYYVRFVKE